MGGAQGAYGVRILPGGLNALGAALRQAGCQGPVALVADDHVGPLWAPQALEGLEAAGYRSTVITLPAGEAHKTLDSVQRLWEGFLSAGLERRSTVVALGGGVVGDLSGFAASTFLRGVPWVATPTTLLAMVDASLGGKTGADLPQGKNLIGAFYPPRLVLADPDTLATLPEAELRGGMAEVVKHGLISDPALFDLCRGGLDALRQNWTEVVRRAAAVKIQVIQEDPYEYGRRASLNLGHTFGHAVELVSGFRLSHGEAVAIGLVAAARLSERLGIASQPQLSELIIETLQGLGLPTEIPPDLPRAKLLAAMQVDKKRAGGKVRFVLPVRVGEVVWGVEAPDEPLPLT
jgi:3-dehydroquinate synthase